MFTISTKTQLNVALLRSNTNTPRSNNLCRAALPKPLGTAFKATKLKEAIKATVIMGGATIPVQSAIAMPVEGTIAEVLQVADVPTPLLYFGFLTSSLMFAVGTYLALTKIKLI